MKVIAINGSSRKKWNTALAAAEEKQEKPDCDVFHNGFMLLADLGCKGHLRRFIDAYKGFLYSASGLDEADLNESLESI